MLKFFSFGKNQSGVLLTLLVLISLGASYFFIYLPNNEKTVQERRFRCLRKIDTNIRTKIENSFAQIANILDNYESHSGLDDYINHYSKTNFTLIRPDQAKAYFNRIPAPIFIRDDTSGRIKYYIDIGSQFTLLGRKTQGDTTVGIRFEYEQFIKPLLPTDIFDNYIIFSSNRKFYESFPAGLNYKDPDSLMSVKNTIISPGIRAMSIGGTDYKLFSHPVYTYTNQDKWTITGLISDKHYVHERNQLPLWALLLLLTVAITMLVSLPWIKLYHMGTKDRLTINDGIASILVSMILMSMLFFIFFKYRFSLKEERLSYQDSTKYHKNINYPIDGYSRNVLATKITDAFVNEINEAYNALDAFDAVHKDGDPDVSSLGKGKQPGQYDRLYNKFSPDIALNQIFWLHRDGRESTNLTIDSNNDPKGNYSGRNYFKNAIAHNYNRTGNSGFYIDQIVSRTEGIFKTVIAKQAHRDVSDAKHVPKDTVVAMTLTIKSLDKVTMPDGYQFAIIDSNGRVLYHSRANRNLNENLKDEFADSSALVSCIEAKSDTSFKAEYYGRSYNVKIKPVPDLPYFAVIFEYQGYNDTRDTEAYTFTLSMLICLILFLIVKFSVVFFASSRQSFFKKQHFDTSWIGPKISSHHQYNLAIIANIFIILTLVISFNLSSFLEYLYILLAAIIFTSIFLNGIFTDKYKRPDPYKYKFKKKAIYALSIFVVFIDFSACIKLDDDHISALFLYELVLIIVLQIFYRRKSNKILKRIRLGIKIVYHKLKKQGEKILSEFNLDPLPWTYIHSFAFMATTRLIIATGIPVAFFFIYSYNYEQTLDTRYRQLNFVQSLVHKFNFKETNTSSPAEKSNTKSNKADLINITGKLNHTPGIYTDGLFIKSVIATDKNRTKTRDSAYTGEDSLTSKLLGTFRFHVNDLEIKNNNLNLYQVDNIISFNNLMNEKGSKTSKIYYKIAPDKYIKICSSPSINYQYPLWYSWLLFILLIFSFYYVIFHIIKKIFALNRHPAIKWEEMDNELLTNNEFNKLALIVGSPGSNTLTKLESWIKGGRIKSNSGQPLLLDKNSTTGDVYVADMVWIPTSLDGYANWKQCKSEALSGYPLIIIDHFEYNINEPKVNIIKLDLLEELIGKGQSKVIIISTVHPVSFIDSFNQVLQNSPISDSELERWHMLLSNFHVLIDPLISSGFSNNIQMPKKAILEETKYSRFLHNMQDISLKYLDIGIKSGPQDHETKGRVTDSIIYKLQLTSQYFYTGIWQSLTREEKFLLYDLAEDGLVNSFDDFNLSMLMCKGLIIDNDGTLVLFNRGFRNFILTAIGKKEVDRIKEQVKDNGKWSNLKMPLNLAILAILVFLFASQQEAYSRVVTYITALGAGIPAVLKIFSMFGNSSASPKTE